jgi:hypothetical protein
MGTKAELLTAFMEMFQSGQADLACQQYMHRDLEIYEPESLPQGGVFRGYDAPLQVTAIYTKLWEVRVLDREIWEADNVAVVYFCMEWTARDSGKSATVPVLESNHFIGGQVSRIQVFHHDTNALLETLR